MKIFDEGASFGWVSDETLEPRVRAFALLLESPHRYQVQPNQAGLPIAYLTDEDLIGIPNDEERNMDMKFEEHLEEDLEDEDEDKSQIYHFLSVERQCPTVLTTNGSPGSILH